MRKHGAPKAERLPARGMQIKLLPESSGCVRSPYLVRELNGSTSDLKQAHRELVRDFIVENHVQVGFERDMLYQAKLCSFPSVSWKFERMMLDAFPSKITFLGIERSQVVAYQSYKEMLGTNAKMSMFLTKIGRIDTYCSEIAELAVVGCRDLMTMGMVGAIPHQKGRAWEVRFKRWTCAWLDFFAPLGSEVLTCAFMIPKHLSQLANKVPVAISFLLGREDEETMLRVGAAPGETAVEKRVAVLVETMASNSAHWNYEFKSSAVTRTSVSQIVTVFGVFSKQDAPKFQENKYYSNALIRRGTQKQ